MKPVIRSLFSTPSSRVLPFACGAAIVCTFSAASATTIPRLDNANTLDTVDAWSGGVVPTATDVAQWTSDVTANGAGAGLAANASFGQLLMQNTTAINIAASGGTLTLGAVNGVGVDMNAAVANLTIATPVSVSGATQWNVPTNRNFSLIGVISGTAPAITMNGVGTVTLNRIETFTTPTLNVNGGTLSLNESSLSGSHVLPSTSILGLAGGTILMTGPASTTDTPSSNTLNVGTGAGTVQMNRGSSGRIAWSCTNANRLVGGTVLFSGNDGSSTARFRLPTTANVNGVIPWATFAGSDSTGGSSGNSISDTWAVARGTSLDMIGYTSASYTASTATSLGTATQNSNVGTDVTLATGGTVNTIRFNSGTSRTVTIDSGTLTVGAGGILVGNALGAATARITGGTLQGGSPGSGSANGLVVIQNDTNANGIFEIDSVIADNVTTTALTKSGPGVLVLGGANTFTGGIYLNQGTLRLVPGGSLNQNPVTFSNNSSGILALGGVNSTLTSLKTTAVVASTAPAVQNASVTAATLTVASATDMTFAGNLQDGSGGGSLGLTKSGAGTFTLVGTNTHTGPTSVNNGTLVAKNGIPFSSVVNVNSPGILDVTTGGLIPGPGGTLSGDGFVLGNVTANSGTNITPGTIGTVATLTVGSLNLNDGSKLKLDILAGGASDRVAVTGSLTLGAGEIIGVDLAGAGTLLSGNTYTILTYGSLTNFTPSSFAISSGAAFGLTYTFADTGSAITLTIGGTAPQDSTWALSTGGSWASPASNWSPAAVPNGTGHIARLGNSIAGPASVALNGSKTVGRLNFNSPNVYTLSTGTSGGLIFNNGTLTALLTDDSVPGNPALPGQVISASVTLNSDTQVAVAGGETLALDGMVSGSKKLIKSGSGTLNLGSSNTLSGGFSLDAGILGFVSGALSDSEVVFNGGTLRFATGNTQDLSFSHILTCQGTAVIDTNGNNVSFANEIGNGGEGGLTKTGSGKLTLETFNSYQGANTIAAGTLSILDDSALGYASFSQATNLTILGGATFQAGADSIFLQSTRNLAIGIGTGIVDTQAFNLAIAGNISGAGVLNKTGAGNLTLSGTGTYGGTLVDSGTLVVGNNAALGSGTVTLNGSSILDLGVRSLANSVVVNGTNGLLSGDGGGVSGISAVSGPGTLNVTISGANVDLRGALTGLTGTIAIAANGTFRINGSTGSSSATFDLGSGTGNVSVRNTSTTAVALGALSGGASTTLTGSGGSGATQNVIYTIGAKTVSGIPVNSVFNGTISNGAGTTGITKTGNSTLTLTAANSYSGPTTVNAGTLLVNGSIGFSTVTVNSPGVLSGGTTLVPGATGAVTVNSGGTISPGSGIGTLSTGNTVLAGTYACDISGTSSDKLDITGNLNISSATLAISGTPTATSYVIATYTGTLTGTAFATVSPALPAGYEVKVDSVNQQILVQVSGYNSWISGFFPGVTDPAIIGKTADPDGDGMTNVTEFALDGNPASGAASGKVVGKIASVSGSPTFVLTLPVRTGATFTAPGSPANGELVSGVVSDLVYKIQGGAGLASWTLGVAEVLGTDKTSIEEGMPALSAVDWTYRTFKLPTTVAASPRNFLRSVIVSQP